MSWTDNQAVKTIKLLRDKFKVEQFIETGTFMGINARLHSFNFESVLTCEKVPEYFFKAQRRLTFYPNVLCVNLDSVSFLKSFVKNYDKDRRKDTVIIYLDAHFYDKNLPKNKRFQIIDELKALVNFDKCILIIHDFDNGLGHITYDGISLDLDLIKKDLMKINPDFKLYTNELATCDIVKPTLKSLRESNLQVDSETLDNLEYAWSSPRLTFRGILYAIPKELNIDLKRL